MQATGARDEMGELARPMNGGVGGGRIVVKDGRPSHRVRAFGSGFGE